MTLPNFLLIGAAKSGTSALYNYLWQHPEIYMSGNKEPNFFALEGETVCFNGPGSEIINTKSVTNLAEYEALFAGVRGEKAVGEASVLYLYHPQAAARIRHYIPDVKLIAILRNPIDRAYSSYLHMVRDGREPADSFTKALDEEPERIRANWAHSWHYQRLGYYHEQLQRYFALFPWQQIAVFTYDAFAAAPQQLLRQIFHFLEVDPSFEPDVSLRYNISGSPRWKRLQKWLLWPNPVKERIKFLLPAYTRKRLVNKLMTLNVKPATKPSMSAAERQRLQTLFRDDILKLQTLLNQDLSHWLRE